jgi:hypothetical protein
MNPAKIQKAIQRCEEIMKSDEGAPPPSILNQLKYLLEIATGRSADRSRLDKIIMGVQAERELEPNYSDFCKLLYEIHCDVDRLLGKPGVAPARA